MQPILILVAVIALSVVLQQLWPIGIYTVYVVASALWQERKYWRDYLAMIRSIRPRHAAIALPTAVVVLSIFFALRRLPADNPLLFSWLNELGEQGTNTIAVPFYTFGPEFGILWGLMLVLALPILALVEERIFRRGTRTRRDVLTRSMIFGLAHCIVGVPLGVGLLALPIGGVVFSLEYLRALRRLGHADLPPKAWQDDDTAWEIEERAIRASATLHLTYNLMLVLSTILLVAISDFLPPAVQEWLFS